jgi:hypothetical protein
MISSIRANIRRNSTSNPAFSASSFVSDKRFAVVSNSACKTTNWSVGRTSKASYSRFIFPFEGREFWAGGIPGLRRLPITPFAGASYVYGTHGTSLWLQRVLSNSVRVQWLSGQSTESRCVKISILMVHARKIITIAALLFCAGSAFAQTADKEEKLTQKVPQVPDFRSLRFNMTVSDENGVPVHVVVLDMFQCTSCSNIEFFNPGETLWLTTAC